MKPLKNKTIAKKIVGVSLVFALSCGMLSACNETTDNIPPTASIPSDQPPAAPSLTEAAGDAGDTSITPAIAPTATPESIPDNEAAYDYSAHNTFPNEEWYRTLLNDYSMIGQTGPLISNKLPPGDYSSFMTFDEASLAEMNDIWAYDMRSCDVSQLDLSVIDDYNNVTFNSETVFPSDIARLPADFDAASILALNKNPGLGIRALHEQGITGAGVGIAIIDQGLLTDHEQYKDNLVYYEQIHYLGESAAMHGAAVSSIAVGKDIGVAPGAKLYYIAVTHGHHGENNEYLFDASILADCILRILDINRQLPEDEKIRVISISRGYGANDKGYAAITKAIEKAKDENVFVITTSTDMYYRDFHIFGADRDYYADPDETASYTPASWITEDLYNGSASSRAWHKRRHIFPMGSRTYAGSTGTEDYEIGHSGGLSWAVPWCAGFYALCCQLKPDITPQDFIALLDQTSTPATVTHNGEEYSFGKLVNPAAVIEQLR